MSVISTGKTFANGEQLTADKLNQVIEQATFNASEAVDGSTLTLISGAMAVNDNGITEGKINNGAVTKAKIENVANMKVLGNTSGSAAAPQEVDILDEDNMSSDSATAIATQQSIKAYVDGTSDLSTNGYQIFPSGLIMQWGTYNTAGTAAGNVTIDFPIHFTTACLNLSATLRKPLGSASGANTVSAELDGSLPLEKFTLGFDEHDQSAGDKFAWWQAIGY